ELIAARAGRHALGAVQSRAPEHRSQFADDRVERRLRRGRSVIIPQCVGELDPTDRSAALTDEVREGNAPLLARERRLIHELTVHLDRHPTGEVNTDIYRSQGPAMLPPRR